MGRAQSLWVTDPEFFIRYKEKTCFQSLFWVLKTFLAWGNLFDFFFLLYSCIFNYLAKKMFLRERFPLLLQPFLGHYHTRHDHPPTPLLCPDFTSVMLFRARAHMCSTQSNTEGGNMLASTQASCATCLCLRCLCTRVEHIPAQRSPLNYYVCCL